MRHRGEQGQDVPALCCPHFQKSTLTWLFISSSSFIHQIFIWDFLKNENWTTCSSLLVLLIDKRDQKKQECDWVCRALGGTTPVHIKRYYPRYYQSHSCWCRPVMNRKHACFSTCIKKGKGLQEATTLCPRGAIFFSQDLLLVGVAAARNKAMLEIWYVGKQKSVGVAVQPHD